jgi:hypothetical protein
MKHKYVLFFSFLFSLSVFALENEDAVTNLRHQVLDYPQEKLFLQMDRPQYEAGDTLWFRAHTVSEAFHLPSAMSRGIFVNLYGPDSKLVERFTLLPLDKRLYSSFLVLPEEMPEGNYRITAYSEQMQGKRSNAYFSTSFPVKNPVRKYVATPVNKQTDYILQFYPEGGKLVDKHLCRVAFTVKDANGNPVEVKGAVYEDKGLLLSEIQTIQPGIGCFNLMSEAGKKYYALIQTDRPDPQYVELPVVSPSGYSLKLADMQDSWYVNVQQAGAEKLSHALKVLLLLRGVPEMTFQLTPEHDFLYLGKSELESGVHEVILLDENDRVLSQRQIFINNDDQVHVSCTLRTDSTISPRKNRDEVLELVLTDAEGKPMTTEFSATLYPDTFQRLPNKPISIGTEFLLGTDLSQHSGITEANFLGSSMTSVAALDAWLIASRWPKFDIQHAIDGDFESSWDIGEKPEETFLRDSTGIYRPLSADEKALRAKYRQIDLNAVNVYPEQLNKFIKPYSYVNHTVKGEDLVTGGSTIQDYLVSLPGVTYDYATEVLLIRNGGVAYLLDGYNVTADVLKGLSTSEIESIDILKDPGNMGLIKFATDTNDVSFSGHTAIGGVVAIWTKRALDVKPQFNKKKYVQEGQKINDQVRRLLMSGTKDIWLSQFPNPSRANLWKPYVVSSENGKAVIRFTPALNVKRYILEMNGVTSKGKLLYDRRIVEITTPNPK